MKKLRTCVLYKMVQQDFPAEFDTAPNFCMVCLKHETGPAPEGNHIFIIQSVEDAATFVIRVP